jgi:DnaD/phage-associated family protein
LNAKTIYTKTIDGSPIDGKCIDIVSTDLDLKEEEGKPKSTKEQTAEVFKFYQENIELLTQYNSLRLGDMIDEYTPAWVLEALKDCVEYNARNLKYAGAILAGWKSKGFRSDTRSKQKAAAHAPAQPAARMPAGV